MNGLSEVAVRLDGLTCVIHDVFNVFAIEVDCRVGFRDHKVAVQNVLAVRFHTQRCFKIKYSNYKLKGVCSRFRFDFLPKQPKSSASLVRCMKMLVDLAGISKRSL